MGSSSRTFWTRHSIRGVYRPRRSPRSVSWSVRSFSVAVPVGVNVLRNDAMAGLAIAAATGARFVRVNVHTGVMLGDQGWLHGEAHETVRLRKRLGVEAAILADVMVKHATPPPGSNWRRRRAMRVSAAWPMGSSSSGASTGLPVDAVVGSVRSRKPSRTRRSGSGAVSRPRTWPSSSRSPTVRSSGVR